jgi:drug/metabolite transporter (DMT)-like permease
MIDESILKKKNILYIYLTITGLVAWYTHNTDRELLKEHNLYTIMIVELVIEVILLLVILYFNFSKNPKKLKNHFSSFSNKDYIILAVMGIWGLITGILGQKFLVHHDIATVRIANMIIAIPVSIIGTYFFLEEKLTTEKIVGLTLVLIGSYFFTK